MIGGDRRGPVHARPRRHDRRGPPRPHVAPAHRRRGGRGPAEGASWVSSRAWPPICSCRPPSACRPWWGAWSASPSATPRASTARAWWLSALAALVGERRGRHAVRRARGGARRGADSSSRLLAVVAVVAAGQRRLAAPAVRLFGWVLEEAAPTVPGPRWPGAAGEAAAPSATPCAGTAATRRRQRPPAGAVRRHPTPGAPRGPRIRPRRSVNVAALVASPEEDPSRPLLRLRIVGLVVLVLFAVLCCACGASR